MPEKKTYWMTVPYCCGVNVQVTTDKEIESDDDALDAFMEMMDEREIRIVFLDKNGKEVDDVFIEDGAYLRRVSSGNVLHAPCHEIDWGEES